MEMSEKQRLIYRSQERSQQIDSLKNVFQGYYPSPAPDRIPKQISTSDDIRTPSHDMTQLLLVTATQLPMAMQRMLLIHVSNLTTTCHLSNPINPRIPSLDSERTQQLIHSQSRPRYSAVAKLDSVVVDESGLVER